MRAWVVQETALAPNALLVCGSRSVFWEDFGSLSRMCRHALLSFSSSSQVSGIDHLEFLVGPTREEVRRNATQALLSLMARSRNTRASDPRDKVFALIGL